MVYRSAAVALLRANARIDDFLALDRRDSSAVPIYGCFGLGLACSGFYMKIALVNSRKPRQFHPDEPWLRGTMALGYAVARCGHTLCASVGTIGYDAAMFGAAMGRGQIEAFVRPGDELEVLNRLPPGTPKNLVAIRTITSNGAPAWEQRDNDVMNAADIVIAVAIRAGGQMESILRNRFHSGKRLHVAVPADEGPLWRGTQRLVELGVPPIEQSLQHFVRECMEARESVQRDELEWASYFPLWRDAPLSTPTLAHFTRAAQGPWPRQTQGEYLGDLWHGGARARRDAPAALRRILQSSTLEASARLIRGSFPVVSFTAVSPEQIADLHRYRSHLVRWDFEPWGIVFNRDWLAKQKACPVKYLPSSSFRNLASNEKAWFQKHEPPECDFSLEEEWRILGDFNFADAPQNAVRLVVGR